VPTATLKIFLVFGDPKRLRTAKLSNWNGIAVTGIEPDTNKSAIYIGEAECIKDRIKSHLSKDFWNNIAFFITSDENLTKAHIRYIEGRLIEIAKSADRSVIMNSQSSGAKLPESDRADMEVFLEKMQQVLPVLGIEAFVQATSKVENEAEREMLTCKIKNVVASGYLTPNGIVVLAGSEAVLEERSSAKKWPSVMVQRNKLIEEGGLIQKGDKYVFVKDTEFSSPSSAAAVIHGGSANGLIAWVNENGKSLKELQNV